MFHAQVAGYTGKQPVRGFISYINEGPFIVVLRVDEGMDFEAGKSILEAIKDSILHEHITSLSSFESVLSSQIFKHNLPAHFSIATGYLYQDNLFVKTIGNGQIYFRRGKNLALLLTGDKSAQGTVQEYDCAVFTTEVVQQVLGDVNDIQLFVDMNAPKDIVEKLHNEEYDEEERGFIAAFAEFTSQAIPTVSEQRNLGINPFADPISEKDPVRRPIIDNQQNDTKSTKSFFSKLRLPNLNVKGSKKIALFLSVVLFCILLWSVVFGYQRREATRFSKKVQEVGKNIDSNLDKAQQEAFLNLEEALELIAQSKSTLNSLKSESNGRNTSEINELDKRIQTIESKIVKKEEKPYKEFYDLALEDKKAEAIHGAYEADSIAMLDQKNATIYKLSIGKKSLEKYTASEVSNALLVALYDETIYFLSKNKGIFKFTTENKVKNVIKYDSEWGNIVDMEIFNGNIYLLDEKEGSIYKYIPTEGGYSEKSSYFTSDTTKVVQATGIAIDSSVYISSADRVQKFTRGEEEKFDTDFPNKSITLNGVYTDSDIEQVYAWDKQHAVIYVLEKTGNYNRQIQSSILKNISGFFTKEKMLYVLSGSKVYSISLD